MTIRKLIFTSSAESDIRESLTWYEDQNPESGNKFIDEVDSLVIRILNNPGHFPQVLPKIHRANLKVFPFSIFFVISDGYVFVIAILHNSRNPQIWKNRKIK